MLVSLLIDRYSPGKTFDKLQWGRRNARLMTRAGGLQQFEAGIYQRLLLGKFSSDLVHPSDLQCFFAGSKFFSGERVIGLLGFEGMDSKTLFKQYENSVFPISQILQGEYMSWIFTLQQYADGKRSSAFQQCPLKNYGSSVAFRC